MKIISHRGFWREGEEKNTLAAFERTLDEGFGTETDVRDSMGSLVISHDPPSANALPLERLLDLWESKQSSFNKKLPLALNIKSDGIAESVKTHLNDRDIEYFVFDMSIPDTRDYMNRGLPFYTRLSEVETKLIWDEKSVGVWLDNFEEGIWFDQSYLESLLAKKRICVVSSELHKRSPDKLWEMLYPLRSNENLTLCTDWPDKAKSYFNNEVDK